MKKLLINLKRYVTMPDGKEYKCIYGEFKSENDKHITLGDEDNFIVIKKKDTLSIHKTNYVCMDETLPRWNVADSRMYEYEIPSCIYFIPEKININLL